MSRPQRTSLLKATLLLATIRFGLSVFPFATVRGVLARLAAVRIGRLRHHEDRAAATELTIWAVETAGRQFPRIGTCLHQALAAHVLLAHRGCSSHLRIGVKRDDSGKFVAHAWLEDDDKILIGGEHHGTYMPMPPLTGLDPKTDIPHQSNMVATRLH